MNYLIKKLLDVPSEDSKKREERCPEYEEVDLNTIEDEEAREIGTEWLCKQMLDRIGLDRCLMDLGWNERWINLAYIYIIGRAVYPASERKTADIKDSHLS
ncbi:MAG: hypothetical protein ACP5KG_12225 [Myxococcota bacterium]